MTPPVSSARASYSDNVGDNVGDNVRPQSAGTRFLRRRSARTRCGGTPPPPDDPNDYTPNARPGARAPHARLAGGALHDRLGPEFTLLRFSEACDPAPMLAAAASRGMPLASPAVEDAAAREVYDAELVLIRPDHHVAWRGGRLPADCGALLDRALGAD